MSLTNFHLPRGDSYAMQQDNNYQDYDSYSSDEMEMREAPHQPNLRSRHHRRMDYSNGEYNSRCKCSCKKCQLQKGTPKACCEEFCATNCVVQNNILVVPYPVPFLVSPPSFEIPTSSSPPPTTTTSTSTTTTEQTTTTEMTTTAITEISTQSTVPYYFNMQNPVKNKRFQILNQYMRRNMGNSGIRSPKFDRLPKYGIVPIPENLARSLMQEIRKDHINDQFRGRVALNKNLMDYTSRPVAQQ